jgi:2-oxoglutarate ferredoxin oxidoreductase subunit alpha
MSGNEAAGEAAIRAGCRFYYGYPITPQNELTGYMAEHMSEVGGTFIQAESELAAISMCHGTSAAGKRVMTSSSSPGISLKQEGISYMAGSELPVVVVNVQRGGPGLGDIGPAQSDYFQATRGGGHGDYRTIVLAPYSVQETAELVTEAFDLADIWRIPVMILTDAQIGQLMEPLVFRRAGKRKLPDKSSWALSGAAGREQHIVKSFFWVRGALERFNEHLREKHEAIELREVRFEDVQAADAEVVIIAYGTPARISTEVVRRMRSAGKKVGLIRPISLWPFPTEHLRRKASRVKAFLVVEMSLGQMVEDVRLAVEGRAPVHFFGRAGCGVPTVEQVVEEVESILRTGRDGGPARKRRTRGRRPKAGGS